MRDERYYFRVKGYMQGEIKTTSSEIEMNIETNILVRGCRGSGQVGTRTTLEVGGVEGADLGADGSRPDWGLGGSDQMVAGARLGSSGQTRVGD